VHRLLIDEQDQGSALDRQPGGYPVEAVKVEGEQGLGLAMGCKGGESREIESGEPDRAAPAQILQRGGGAESALSIGLQAHQVIEAQGDVRPLGQHEAVEYHFRSRLAGPNRQGGTPRLHKAQAVIGDRCRQGGPFHRSLMKAALQRKRSAQSPQPEGAIVQGEAGMAELKRELVIESILQGTGNLRAAKAECGRLIVQLQVGQKSGRKQLPRHLQGVTERDLSMAETRGETALAIKAVGGGFSPQPSPAVKGEVQGVEAQQAGMSIAMEAQRQINPGAEKALP